MSCRGVQKTDADGANGLADLQTGQIDTDAQRFQHIGGAAPGASRAVAVLGDARSGSDCHDRGGGGNIECVEAVAAGSASVPGKYRRSVFAGDVRESREFGGLNRSAVEGGEQAHDVRR